MACSTCPVCGSHCAEVIAEFPQVPVLCNALLASAESARNARKGDIVLALCFECAMIWNQAFDETLLAYSAGYENALHHSKSFQAYARSLVSGLIRRHDLRGGVVFEIGCGDGYLLKAFVDQGVAKAIGFDPSMTNRSGVIDDEDRVQIRAEAFDARQTPDECNLVVCRHVLEHIADPKSFLNEVLTSLPRTQVPLYFEVPNTQWLLSEPSPWDVIYEHVGYWTEPSLIRLFHDAGCRVMRWGVGYGEQFLQIEAIAGSVAAHEQPAVFDVIAAGRAFAASTQETFAYWRGFLGETDARIVVWGAGSKGITFANFAENNGHRIEALVDLNPLKHGRFVPGAAIEVIDPSALVALRPDVVVISNGLYRAEIENQLEALGIAALTKVLL